MMAVQRTFVVRRTASPADSGSIFGKAGRSANHVDAATRGRSGAAPALRSLACAAGQRRGAVAFRAIGGTGKRQR